MPGRELKLAMLLIDNFQTALLKSNISSRGSAVKLLRCLPQ